MLRRVGAIAKNRDALRLTEKDVGTAHGRGTLRRSAVIEVVVGNEPIRNKNIGPGCEAGNVAARCVEEMHAIDGHTAGGRFGADAVGGGSDAGSRFIAIDGEV